MNILLLNGQPSYLHDTWMQRRLGLTNTEFVDGVRQMILEARSDWKADSAPVLETLAKVNKFLLERQVGDELWEFSSPPESWRQMAGRGGYAIVRPMTSTDDGGGSVSASRLVAVWVTHMN